VGFDIIDLYPFISSWVSFFDTSSKEQVASSIEEQEVSVSTHCGGDGVILSWVFKLLPTRSHWDFSGNTSSEVSESVSLSTNEATVFTDIDLDEESIFN